MELSRTPILTLFLAGLIAQLMTAEVIPGGWEKVSTLEMASPMIVELRNGDPIKGQFQGLAPLVLELRSRAGRAVIPKSNLQTIATPSKEGRGNGAGIGAAIDSEDFDLQSSGDPVLAQDQFVETTLGNPDGVDVSVVDAVGFDPGAHGQRITDTFLANTDHARLVQIGGWGTYRLNNVEIVGINATGYIRHVLKHGAGIFWTASDHSPIYTPERARSWFMENNRAFHIEAREFATWMQDQKTLFIASVENASGAGNGHPLVAVYCDDFNSEASEEDWWIPRCGALDDYIAHSGVGLANTIFVGAIDTRFGDLASGAIRADGVFAPHTIYVESPDGSTSQATPVLAAYATNLAFANPSWGAARLKQELMNLAREEIIDYHTGATTAQGTIVAERRTIKAIRPPKPSALDFPHFANGDSITSDFVLVNVDSRPVRPALYFYDRDGDRIAAESVVEVTGDLKVTEDGALTVQTEIVPLGELTISTHGRGETVSGSVRVVSNGPIAGVLRFDIPGVGVAGVGAGQGVRDAIFPARRQADGINTGVAIRNLGQDSIEVTCQLMQAGRALETKGVALAGNGQSAQFIHELFPGTDTSDFEGSVRCTASGGGKFTGVALELDAGNRIFTTLPVVPIPR